MKQWNKREAPWSHGPLRPAENGRYIEHADGTPYFRLGDTGWLLFTRLGRDEAPAYLDYRRERGFNIIQAMMVHRLPAADIFGRRFV
jgi:hypothetical protein